DYMIALAELSVLDAGGKNLALGARVTSLDSIEVPPRWSRKNLVDGITPAASSPADLAKLREQRHVLLDRLLDGKTKRESAEITRGLAEVGRALAKLPQPHLVYAGTVFSGGGAFSGTGPMGGHPRSIHILPRGDVKRPGREVGPGALSAVRDLPARFD